MTAGPTALPDGAPPLHAPFLASGRYEVAAGLARLGDGPVFAFDRDLPRFVAEKAAARARLHLAYLQAALPPALRRAVLERMLPKLALDSGGAVSWEGGVLSNAWLGWAARVDPEGGALGDVRRFDAPLADLVAEVEPLDALDFLALNAPEDFAVVARRADSGEDWLAAVHVVVPQGWDPRDKVGRAFGPVHAPVGGSAPLIATAPRLVPAMVEKGPFERFAWGLHRSDSLGQHPARAPQGAGHGDDASFDPERVWLRVERQTLTPFPEEGGAFFTIRPYVYALADVAADPARRTALASALRSMGPEHLAYKGIVGWRDAAAGWLEGGGA